MYNARLFRFEIHVRAGRLYWGCSEDFLVLVTRAQNCKRRFAAELPQSTVRVKLFDSRNHRVPLEDIRSALRALADEKVRQSVAVRLDVVGMVGVPGAARSDVQARAGFSSFLTLPVGSGFCQAGVVAPPDSPDLGNLPVVAMAGASLGV
jgi:hypothetical protein